MRLSEVKGERVFDVIADIIEPACSIAQDKEAAKLFSRGDIPEGVDSTEYVLGKVKASLPKLMRGHKDDLVAILAALNDEDPTEYAKTITIPALLKGVYEILTDEDLLAFLS